MIFLILAALLIGLSLGLLGSGGSILTVPVLVYVLAHPGKAAIAESLAIVGGIALVAAVPFAVRREIDWRSVIFFGLPGMAGAVLGAWLSSFVPGAVQLLLFAVVMLVAAGMMFRKTGSAAKETKDEQKQAQPPHRQAAWKIALEGVGVGVLTGLVGVGGGFLIIPALVLLGGLEMRLAVGTSLVIIALKSLAGFVEYLHVLQTLDVSIDWWTVAVFLAIGMAGSFAGSFLGTRINQQMLRRVFTGFLVVMSVFVLAMEAPKLLQTPQDVAGAPVSTAVQCDTSLTTVCHERRSTTHNLSKETNQ